jgi:hypothetical protein
MKNHPPKVMLQDPPNAYRKSVNFKDINIFYLFLLVKFYYEKQ